jgi:hypothetical protein
VSISPQPDPQDRPAAEALRFRGLSESSRAFFASLDHGPCPSLGHGAHRIAYAAHVLSPLKAFVADLGRLLSDVLPRLTLEPRVGDSLYWTGNPALPPEKCPVRVVRTWDASRSPDSSPVLSVTFRGSAIEVALDGGSARSAAGEGPTVPDEELALAARGWRVAPSGRVSRELAWDPRLDDPELVSEVADLFRELMPLFRALVSPAGEEDVPKEERSAGASR